MHEGIRKLKLERFDRIALKDLPAEVTEFAGSGFAPEPKQPPYDCIITAALSLEDMRQTIAWAAAGQLRPDGVLFVLYPKKGNPRYDFYVHRDDIFLLDLNDDGFFEPTDLKLNSMTSFDEVFTVAGMKRIVSRSYQRPKISQSAEDYRDRLPELKELLTAAERQVLEGLAPGYQAGWARYIFSAVQQATRDKRLDETKKALAGGFKSIEFYKNALKK